MQMQVGHGMHPVPFQARRSQGPLCRPPLFAEPHRLQSRSLLLLRCAALTTAAAGHARSLLLRLRRRGLHASSAGCLYQRIARRAEGRQELRRC